MGRIGLNEILVVGNSDTATIFSAHDPHRDGLTNTERISNRPASHHQLRFLPLSANVIDGEILRRDLNHGDVRLRVGANDRSVIDCLFVRECHFDLVRSPPTTWLLV